MLGRGAGAAAADCVLQRHPVEFDIAPDRDVVDGDAGILAKQISCALSDCDVFHHGAEDGAAGRVGLTRDEALETRLDVAWQQLERAHIERLADLLDFFGIELHGGSYTTRIRPDITSSTAKACRNRVSSRWP